MGETFGYEVRDGSIQAHRFTPELFGLSRVRDFSEIAGGTAKENAARCLQLLKGDGPRAPYTFLLLNSACGLFVRGMCSSIHEGLYLAERTIREGAARDTFLRYKAFAQDIYAKK
jgi:anthranilate phosphoribosyltransferase